MHRPTHIEYVLVHTDAMLLRFLRILRRLFKEFVTIPNNADIELNIRRGDKKNCDNIEEGLENFTLVCYDFSDEEFSSSDFLP